MNTHTPTPWAIRDGWANKYDIYPLRDGPPELGEWAEVASVESDYGEEGEGKANAELIVKAVNSHPALVKALKEIKGLKPTPIGDTGFSVGPLSLLQRAQRIARAALAQAKGTQP